jgi:hypothetical protein
MPRPADPNIRLFRLLTPAGPALARRIVASVETVYTLSVPHAVVNAAEVRTPDGSTVKLTPGRGTQFVRIIVDPLRAGQPLDEAYDQLARLVQAATIHTDQERSLPRVWVAEYQSRPAKRRQKQTGELSPA